MSISDYLNKIKADGGWAMWLALILALGLGVGVGRLWNVQANKSPLNIIEPKIVESSQATVIGSSQALEKTEEAVVKKSGQYVASKNSTKYHLPWCPGAARIKEENKIWFASKTAAEKAGLTPAANCPGI